VVRSISFLFQKETAEIDYSIPYHDLEHDNRNDGEVCDDWGPVYKDCNDVHADWATAGENYNDVHSYWATAGEDCNDIHGDWRTAGEDYNNVHSDWATAGEDYDMYGDWGPDDED